MTDPTLIGSLGRAMPARGMARGSSGVTLIELMVALTVVAVLLGFGIPSYRDAQVSSRLNALSSSLLASVTLARSEAIKSNTTTTLCVSTDHSTCTGPGDWDLGWVVLDADGAVLSYQDAAPDGYKVVEASATDTLSFQPIGLGASSAAFTVCRETPLGSQERVLSVTLTGSTHVSRTETGVCP